MRALDRGETTELFSDADVYVTVGDVSNNDGGPQFSRPEVDEVAYVAEVRLRNDYLSFDGTDSMHGNKKTGTTKGREASARHNSC